MIRFPLRPIALLAVLASLSCSSGLTSPLDQVGPYYGIWSGYLTATATPNGIEVANGTDSPDPFYLFAIEREMTALADWIPCTGGPGCPSLLPGERRILPWASIPGYGMSKHEYVVYFWHVTRASDGSASIAHMQRVVVTR